MNKTEMTAALAAKTGLTKKDAEKALTAVVDVITEALVAGEKVQMVGFGAFEVKARPERTAHNPHNPLWRQAGALSDSCGERDGAQGGCRGDVPDYQRGCGRGRGAQLKARREAGRTGTWMRRHVR